MVLLQLKDPLELFVKRREFLPGLGILSRRDMTKAVESDVKPQTFLWICILSESLHGGRRLMSTPSWLDSRLPCVGFNHSIDFLFRQNLRDDHFYNRT